MGMDGGLRVRVGWRLGILGRHLRLDWISGSLSLSLCVFRFAHLALGHHKLTQFMGPCTHHSPPPKKDHPQQRWHGGMVHKALGQVGTFRHCICVGGDTAASLDPSTPRPPDPSNSSCPTCWGAKICGLTLPLAPVDSQLSTATSCHPTTTPKRTLCHKQL